MSAARDELARVIHARICEESIDDCLEWWGQCLRAAEETLADGWTKLDMQVAPTGYQVTAPMVEEVWNTFIKPGQNDDAPPQSAETRVLMAILRGVYAALSPVVDQ